jgi:hypothetical protein
MTTYKKLKDGSFGVIGPVDEVRPNSSVTVRKKDGSTKTETVVKVTKPFASFDGSGMKVIGFLAPRTHGTGPRRSGSRYECEECGDMVTPGSQCWETGMTH